MLMYPRLAQTYYTAEEDFELLTLHPLPPMCCECHKGVPPCLMGIKERCDLEIEIPGRKLSLYKAD